MKDKGHNDWMYFDMMLRLIEDSEEEPVGQQANIIHMIEVLIKRVKQLDSEVAALHEWKLQKEGI